MPNNLEANTTQLANSSTAPSANDKNERSVVEMKNAQVDRITPQDQDAPLTHIVIVTLIPTSGESQMDTDESDGHSQSSR
jgi:hypothetical protein